MCPFNPSESPGNLAALSRPDFWKVTQLAERFRVSRLTIYAVLKRTRLQEFTPRKQYQPAVQNAAVRPQTLSQGGANNSGTSKASS